MRRVPGRFPVAVLFCVLACAASAAAKLPVVAMGQPATGPVTLTPDEPSIAVAETAQATPQPLIDQVSERIDAPLYSRRLWSQAARDWRTAWPRFEAFIAQGTSELRTLFREGGSRVWMGLLLSVAFWLAAAWALPRTVSRIRPRLPEGRVRRSLPALLRVLGMTLISVLAVVGMQQAMLWGGGLDTALATWLDPLAGMLVFATFMISLGRNMLSCEDAALRLPNIPDEVVSTMRHGPLALAVAAAIATLMDTLAMRLLAAQSAAAVLMTAAVTLFLAFALASVWSRLGAALRRDVADGKADERHLFVLRAVVLIGWALILASLLATLLGYYAAGNLIIKQTLWGVVVLLFLYLVATASGDAIDAYLRGDGPAGLRLSRRLGLEARKVDQMGALLYGLVRLLLIIAGVVLLAAPYGLGPGELFGQLHPRTAALVIGKLRLSPGDLLRALVVFAVTLLASRLFGRWFSRRYLPTTRLDAGMRNSLASIAAYAGGVVAISLALAAMGVSLEKITWIASALTVGIGFGLQAIVQNFISGLILLAERPVRVGDWVVVGDAEGDVRRINVRATEITTPDRTTVLIPNSDLITKVVRNRTLIRSEGLVKILLPLPAATTDIEKAFAIIQDVIASNAEVQRTPPPQVMIEEVKDNRFFINISVYVEGPRKVASVRGALLFEMLRRLPVEGVPLA